MGDGPREGRPRAGDRGASGGLADAGRLRGRDDRLRHRDRPRRPRLAEERGRAPAAPRVAPPAPARDAHLGRPRRPPRPRDPRPRAGRARGGRHRRHRADLPAAVDPRDDPHRSHADRGHGRRDVGDVRGRVDGRHRRRRRPPEDDGRHRRLPRGRLLDVHDRPRRARGLRRRHRRRRHAARPRDGPALGRPRGLRGRDAAPLPRPVRRGRAPDDRLRRGRRCSGPR